MEDECAEAKNGVGHTQREVDAMLEDRDRLWCLALISSCPYIGIDDVQSVLRRYNVLRSREREVLAVLHNPGNPVRL